MTNTFVSIIGSSSSTVVSTVFFLTLTYRRDALLVSFFLGAICNGISSKVLKKIINQKRPPEQRKTDTCTHKPSDGGMPSSHGMSLGFIGMFTSLCLPFWTHFFLWFYVSISLLYRVQANLHTWLQVVVGVTLGSFNGWIWWSLCMNDKNPLEIQITYHVSYLLDKDGLLPQRLLIVPAIVGVLIVGSFERRIPQWMANNKA
eukprot:Awhi_evm1s14842